MTYFRYLKLNGRALESIPVPRSGAVLFFINFTDCRFDPPLLASDAHRQRTPRVRRCAMKQSSAPVVLAAVSGGERAGSGAKWLRRSLWVLGASGLIAVLVFQYTNELARLNAYGRKYFTGVKTHGPVSLFENTPHDVVVKPAERVKPPMAPQTHPKPPPPPVSAVPSGDETETKTAASGKPPSPSLQEFGWVAWPPPNPPPLRGSDSETGDPTLSATTTRSPPPPPLGPKPTAEASPDSESTKTDELPGYQGWDARVGWPPPGKRSDDTSGNSQEKESPGREKEATSVGQEEVSSESQNSQDTESQSSQDTTRQAEPSPAEPDTWQAPPEWNGWVAWPPPNPPPSQ